MDPGVHLFGEEGEPREWADPVPPLGELGPEVPEADALDQATPATADFEPDPASGFGDDEPPDEADPADVIEQRTEVRGLGEDEDDLH
ncbi:MAG: hypothetical protein QOI35_2453 [Cryptosporangiaceae bacterium]|nr:hypothetical protein [Cryptosporangiaceae bacterium]